MIKPIKFTDGNSRAIVSGQNWPLLSDLLSKWNIDVPSESPESLKVNDLQDKLYELSAWGIPWKRS